MTDNNHPITPPPELVQAFLRSNPVTPDGMTYEEFIATRFARWGADMELEACRKWLSNRSSLTEKLRAARRPKPLSLKEQALQELERIVTLLMPVTGSNKVERFAIIRRALEQLDDH